MASHRDRTFTDEDVVIDGHTFTGCTFKRCRIIFRGQMPKTFSANTFDAECQWVFSGAAANTIEFLTALYESPGSRGIVEDTLTNIRTGIRPQL